MSFNQTFQNSLNQKKPRETDSDPNEERKGKIHFNMDALKREQQEMMLFSNVNQVNQPLGLLSPINNFQKKKIHNPHRNISGMSCIIHSFLFSYSLILFHLIYIRRTVYQHIINKQFVLLFKWNKLQLLFEI